MMVPEDQIEMSIDLYSQYLDVLKSSDTSLQSFLEEVQAELDRLTILEKSITLWTKN